MPAVLAGWPDAEDVVMALVDPAVAPAVQSTPSDWSPPLIQVRQVGGANDGISDRPVVEVACFGDTYGDAKTMAAEVRQIILAAGGTTVLNVAGHPDGVLVDKTATVAPPREVTYEDPTMRRKTASYRLVMRRPRNS